MTTTTRQAHGLEDTLTLRDSIALMLLLDFKREGFPSPDPMAQVNAAYIYADFMAERRTFSFSSSLEGINEEKKQQQKKIEE
jgi:hypothetical protein